MARLETPVLDHLEWLGYAQPTGLVVSASALVKSNAILNRHDADGQRRLQEATTLRPIPGQDEPAPILSDFVAFASSVLGWNWSPKGYAGSVESPIPDELVLHLPDHDATITPNYAVGDRRGEAPDWQLLVIVWPDDQDLDATVRTGHLEASPHGRLERLLRNTGVTAGLLSNGRTLRLLSAPKGESSGWIDFHVPDMVKSAGRPICAALRLLLSQRRLLQGPSNERLAGLLRESRKYQNDVSERLAEQVLHSLYELLRGLQAANEASNGRLLEGVLDRDPNQVYRALLTVLLRTVFLLYAEERGMLPQDDAFLKHYSLTGLHERLREEAALFPDTMDQRYGAWAQLLVLFRMVHDGAKTGDLDLPARHGALFDPDSYPFLDGRTLAGTNGHPVVPLVPDGTVQRALESLLVLAGERLSYRARDVEQIGSVYETMMGFRIETACGPSVAIRASTRTGAPTVIDLQVLLDAKPADRSKRVADDTGRKLAAGAQRAVKDATTLEDLHAALHGVIDQRATPEVVPKGSLVLQPSDERRRSGSHYTPRELTEPIVRTTLEPILARLAGDDPRGPTPEQLLDLKVCDPAMGSGAFLVEACRQLGDALVAAWRNHESSIQVPTDEDATIYARRLVAQRCLYGVDRNPVAVDLAKVSLWLVTLAREHPLTFLDHALRHGDSLVGLSKKQLQAFHWDETQPNSFAAILVSQGLERALALREQIRNAGDDVPDADLRALWQEANGTLGKVRLHGDLVIAAFFEADSAKARLAKLAAYAKQVGGPEAEAHAVRLREWRRDDARPLAPFHWEVEFPEVFERVRPGFDAFVGNPPFMGGRNLSAAAGETYTAWIMSQHPESSGGADLVAHFFRRTFNLLRDRSTLGLIATNTIAQGDTRVSGLRWICHHRGQIYAAQRRVRWPGLAAVIVSVVHVAKGLGISPVHLDGRPTERLTAFLFSAGGHDNPARLKVNSGKSFVGSYILGMGFTFDDADSKGVATPVEQMRRLIERDPRNAERIFPYIGGEEVNSSPTHAHHRYVINFEEMDETQARTWPDLWRILEEKVKPERITKDANKYPRMVNEWWKYWNARPELVSRLKGFLRCAVLTLHAPYHLVSFAALPAVFSHGLAIFPTDKYSALSSLQSRPHELWARFFGSSLEDRLRYTPSDCFETFPFPEDWTTRPDLETVGQEYYEYRAQLMIDNNEGLTKTYNRFHDPEEHDPRIVRLRELHAQMDRAVLDAYGWTDIPTDCEFLLDYEIDEEEYANRKKPYRYRWPDAVHDEVLGRLLELNAQRAAAETAASAGASNAPKRRKATPDPRNQGDLFS